MSALQQQKKKKARHDDDAVAPSATRPSDRSGGAMQQPFGNRVCVGDVTFANVPARTTFAVCPPLPRAKRQK